MLLLQTFLGFFHLTLGGGIAVLQDVLLIYVLPFLVLVQFVGLTTALHIQLGNPGLHTNQAALLLGDDKQGHEATLNQTYLHPL